MVTYFSPSLASPYLDHYCGPLTGPMTCFGYVNDSQETLRCESDEKNEKVTGHLSLLSAELEGACV